MWKKETKKKCEKKQRMWKESKERNKRDRYMKAQDSKEQINISTNKFDKNWTL